MLPMTSAIAAIRPSLRVADGDGVDAGAEIGSGCVVTGRHSPSRARGGGRRARCVDRPRGRVRATTGLRMLDALACRDGIERPQSLPEVWANAAGAIADADRWLAENWRTSNHLGVR